MVRLFTFGTAALLASSALAAPVNLARRTTYGQEVAPPTEPEMSILPPPVDIPQIDDPLLAPEIPEEVIVEQPPAEVPKDMPKEEWPVPPKDMPKGEYPVYQPPAYEPPVHEPPKDMPKHEMPKEEVPKHEVPKEEWPAPEPPKDMPKEEKPQYGSGHNEWGKNYEDCVSQCVAKYGAPTGAEWKPKEPTKTGEPGAGATHTVIVAPVDGVPRYLPYALNATVGDTVRFVWPGTVDHSVTMGSELNLCGKSESEGAFDSGLLNGSDGEKTFDVVVDSTDPKYFYCSAGEHCNKGMWGIINPKSSFGGENTVGGKMQEWVESNPDLKAAWDYIESTTEDGSALKWGESISLDGIPEDQYLNVAQNTMWTRANFAANPGMQDFGHGAAKPDGSAIEIVGDLNAVLAEANTGAPAPENAAAPAPSEPQSSSAFKSTHVSQGLVAAIVVAASVFMF